jgi:sn-glycerol 3-phosphate transport system ATP-binding protein
VATVDLKDVKKIYAGGVEAVKGVSIAIPDKALCVLVGPSGCGKSTLLRMIAGLESISAGTVSIDGKVVNAIGPTERDIAMVFQNYALYPHMKVYDNMAYGLRNRGTPKDEIDKRVRETAKTLELSALLDRRPRELSGGQRQRAQPEGLPVRRAALQSRRQIARPDAGRDQESAARARCHFRLCHARPARGDDAR